MLNKVFLPQTKNRNYFFKTLKGKNTLNFGKGINCIIGPNASGKTTILNGFRWIPSLNKGWNPVSIPSPSDVAYSFNIYIASEEAKVLYYEPQSYTKYNTNNIQDIFNSGDTSSTLMLTMFRQSEAECASMYFQKWFAKNRETLFKTPCILIADEIENSNDPDTIDAIMNVFRGWCQGNPDLQILIATHSPIVLYYADHIVELKKDYGKEIRDIFLRKILNL